VNRVLEKLKKEANAYLSKMKIIPENRELIFTLEARYPGQVWQLTLPLKFHRFRNKQELAQIVKGFHNLHEQVYSVKNPKEYVEFVEWDVEVIGKLSEFAFEEQLGKVDSKDLCGGPTNMPEVPAEK